MSQLTFIPVLLTDLADDKVFLDGTAILVAEHIPLEADPECPIAHTKVYLRGKDIALKVKETPEEINDIISEAPLKMAQKIMEAAHGMDPFAS